MAGAEHRFFLFSDNISGLTKVIQVLEAKECALKASEVAKLLGVTRQHIYKLAAAGNLPSFRVGTAVRFDPRQIAEWLKIKMPVPMAPARAHKLAV